MMDWTGKPDALGVTVCDTDCDPDSDCDGELDGDADPLEDDEREAEAL